MALTTYLISQASDHLSSVSIELWKTLFRELPQYREYALVYSPLIEDALRDTEGTIKARQLNALMTLLDDLGPGEFSIKGDSDGLNYSAPSERLALINEAFSVIFDSINTMITSSSSVDNYGVYAAIGDRSICNRCKYVKDECFCNRLC
jgi:hypothetical protein